MTVRMAIEAVTRGLWPVFCLLCCAAPLQAADGLVFRVSGAAHSAYLVGTMHSEDARVMARMARYRELIGEVDIVAIEMVPDALSLVAVGAASLLPGGQTLRELIGEQRFLALSEAARQRGIPPVVLERLKPWAAAVTLGMPAAETGRFLDLEIYLEALARERRVVGLETAAEQLAVFDGMATELQVALLDDMVKNAAELPKQLEELTTAYLAGDLDGLDAAARAQYADMPAEVALWFDEVLLVQRNHRMVERVSALLDEGSLLVAVGAMHLGGDSGLIAGLRRAGYRVEPDRRR